MILSHAYCTKLSFSLHTHPHTHTLLMLLFYLQARCLASSDVVCVRAPARAHACACAQAASLTRGNTCATFPTKAPALPGATAETCSRNGMMRRHAHALTHRLSHGHRHQHARRHRHAMHHLKPCNLPPHPPPNTHTHCPPPATPPAQFKQVPQPFRINASRAPKIGSPPSHRRIPASTLRQQLPQRRLPKSL